MEANERNEMNREERKQMIRKGYENYPDHTLQSVVRYNTQVVANQNSAQREEFGHDLVMEVAKEILAERSAS